ncbi:MAG: CoB--CoM heterodisulfide reductase iron-sulfur subunit A family protein [Planctomycetota bacterium]|nr:CoB--CoM heterodisulfide reductase iron-sulfur subunit A family protein [Planctomycetota bacterium]
MPEHTDNNARDASPREAEHEDIRLGVYTCYCGGNISDVVDCEKVAQQLGQLPNVVVSRTDESMCSDTGQAKIAEDIKEHGINRVIIGACAPSLHEQTFRNTLSRAGLNPYLYYHVGLREQDSWVHGGARDCATAKAVRLMASGLSKARLLEPLEAIRLEAEQHALVIGGGVAGLRAALCIARRGLKVTLIEKSPFLGGRTAQLEALFPTGEAARDSLDELIGAIRRRTNITVLTRAEVIAIRGYVGDFQAEVRVRSRGVSDDLFDAAAIIDACPVEVPDEFNYGLTKRKAIYRPYEGCEPSAPAIDWEACTRCGECARIAPDAIDLEAKTETRHLNIGAIVVATGFDPYEPREGELGYGRIPEVITLPQLIRLLAFNNQNGQLHFNGHPVRNIGLMHCVGSRQIEGTHEPQEDGQVNNYCSRVCCTASLQAANELKERFPDTNLFEFYQDIRTYGRGHEDIYEDACGHGVTFLRYLGEEPPVIEAADEPEASLVVRVRDTLTFGEELEVPLDLLVLSVGMMPTPVPDLIELLKISPGTDRFLLEVHPKLRPVETAVPGIVLAGTAQGPMNTQEACAAASAAAAKVGALLGSGAVELDPYVAEVDVERCDGNGTCVEVCAYEDAITLESTTVDGRTVQRASITPANCVGCGVCVGACPNRALSLKGWTLEQYEAMVDAIAADSPAVEVGV